MSDYIKREDALSAVIHAMRNLNHECEAIMDFYRALWVIPDGDVVEVKHGKWEIKTVRGESELYCSVCGNSSGILYEYRFCPNCGAKMDLEDDND